MVELVGVVALVVSVLILAWQTSLLRRQAARQTDVELAYSGVATLEMLHGVLHFLVEDPTLRPYFYEGTPPPTGVLGRKVATVAEMLADCVEAGLDAEAHDKLASPDIAGWPAYGRFLRMHSPAVADVVNAQPDWYPRYSKL